MLVINERDKALIKAWTDCVPIENEAKQQLLNTASLPFIYKHIAVMPDVHWGMGSTVGSVVPTIRAIVPAMVGVDLGCGMIYQPLLMKSDELTSQNLKDIFETIDKMIPSGRTNNGGLGDRGAWGTPPPLVMEVWKEKLAWNFDRILSKHPSITGRNNNWLNHLGTLGTGNHFIEIVEDENHQVGILLHSGSRGIGNAIARFFIEKAKREMERWFIHLPDKDLAYLPEDTQNFNDYVFALQWAQEFAWNNRLIMLERVKEALVIALNSSLLMVDDDALVHCHHNYVEKEHHFGQNVWITRKGAVRARTTDFGIIPGSMGKQSYIVKGKGNPESFNSCSHGAGRAMSRTEARKRFSIEDHIKATEGIECIKDKSVLDETPQAYKEIDAVMKSQEDLVEVVHTLKQLVNIKGRDDKHG